MSEYSRRDFLFLSGAVAGTIAVGATAWPFIAQMLPDNNLLSLSTVDVDLTAITMGMSVIVKWQGKPVMIRHRTPTEIASAKAINIEDLKDKYARNANLPNNALATDEARSAGINKDKWLVVINICTHLGCIPKEKMGKYGGWLCPCHGSVYDTAGRIRSGPADKNLFIPPYKFLSDNLIRIG